ncbi:MAG: hypothetical protein ACI8Q1_000174 [Parvicella sp.]
MKLKHILILISSLFLCNFLVAQKVSLNYTNLSLDSVLSDISDKYQVEYSIDANIASDCFLSIDTTFNNLQYAFRFLASNCELELQKIGSVFVFKIITIITKPKSYVYQGTIIDLNTSEPLPYAAIQVGGRVLIADDYGFFSCKCDSSQENIKVNYLGYQIKDTLTKTGTNLQISLASSTRELGPINVKGTTTYYKSSGAAIAQVKFNDIASNLVMGNSNNLLFNTIRLHPGIAASGEATSDYLIWGSYPGQNRIEFDGVTLFNSRGVNDEIGRVNAFLVKDIELFKGAYNVDIGEGVGGVMIINGKKGNTDSVNLLVGVNNNVSNAYINIPFKGVNSNLQLASRISHTNLFQQVNQKKGAGNYYYPDYNFYDFNVKFNADLSTSERIQLIFLNSTDFYQESISQLDFNDVYRDVEIRSKQTGGSFQYKKLWKQAGISSLVLSYSDFVPEYLSKSDSTISSQNAEFNYFDNQISEQSIRLNHQFPVKKWLNIFASAAYINNSHAMLIKNNNVYINQSERIMRRAVFLAKNNMKFGVLQLQPGIRMDLTLGNLQPNLQPRINGKLMLNQNLELNFGWGLYRQFITKSLLTDNFNQRAYFWQTSNPVTAPVITSDQSAVGFSFNKNRIEASTEFYYKTINSISRYFIEDSIVGLNHSVGEAKIYGMDMLFRVHLNRLEIIASYSLGRALERFEQGSNQSFYTAPQNQTHEVKLGFISRYKKIRFSVNQVQGSGFTNELTGVRSPYSRMDIGVEYDLVSRKTDIDIGISILNVLNRKNNRLDQFASFPNGTQSFAAGIPFTPNINLMLKF